MASESHPCRRARCCRTFSHPWWRTCKFPNSSGTFRQNRSCILPEQKMSQELIWLRVTLHWPKRRPGACVYTFLDMTVCSSEVSMEGFYGSLGSRHPPRWWCPASYLFPTRSSELKTKFAWIFRGHLLNLLNFWWSRRRENALVAGFPRDSSSVRETRSSLSKLLCSVRGTNRED